MIQINDNNNEIPLTAIDNRFVNLINNRITAYGQIPYTIPKQLIVDVIISSAKFFYIHHSLATTKKFYVIHVDDMTHNNLSVTGTSGDGPYYSFQLGSNIRVVMNVYETVSTPGIFSGGVNGDFGRIKATAGQSYSFGGGATMDEMAGINNNLYMVENAVRMVETSAWNNIFKKKPAFDYNSLSKELIVFEKPETVNIVLEVLSDIHIYNFYDNSFFEKHVIASCKQELRRIIGGHTIELPGGATLNVDEICKGDEEKETIETKIMSGSGVGDIIMKR